MHRGRSVFVSATSTPPIPLPFFAARQLSDLTASADHKSQTGQMFCGALAELAAAFARGKAVGIDLASNWTRAH